MSPGRAAALLCLAVPPRRGGLDLLRSAHRAQRAALGGAHAGRLRLRRQGLRPAHRPRRARRPHAAGAAGLPARSGARHRRAARLPEGLHRRTASSSCGSTTAPASSRCARRGKLGALLFQFAPWFIPTRRNRDYLARAGAAAAGRHARGGVPRRRLDGGGHGRPHARPARAPRTRLRERRRAPGLPQQHAAASPRRRPTLPTSASTGATPARGRSARRPPRTASTTSTTRPS